MKPNVTDFFLPILSDERICDILYQKWSCHYPFEWTLTPTSTPCAIFRESLNFIKKKDFSVEDSI